MLIIEGKGVDTLAVGWEGNIPVKCEDQGDPSNYYPNKSQDGGTAHHNITLGGMTIMDL